MKKTIIIALTLITLMTLVGCGEKGEPIVESHTIEEHFISETIEEETIEEETIEREELDFGDYEYSLTEEEYDALIRAYKKGLISTEYLEEVLFNARIH